MAYSTKDEVEIAAGGPEKLTQLTDVKRTGSYDQAVLDDAIADADAWIDSYAHKRFKTGFSAPIPRIIKALSAREAVFLLKVRRQMDQDDDRERHESDERWLRDLAGGRASVGVEPLPTQSVFVGSETLERSTDEDVSRDALKGFA